jgi:hypothetical protein
MRHGDLGGLGAVVDVGLVQGDESPALPFEQV